MHEFGKSVDTILCSLFSSLINVSEDEFRNELKKIMSVPHFSRGIRQAIAFYSGDSQTLIQSHLNKKSMENLNSFITSLYGDCPIEIMGLNLNEKEAFYAAHPAPGFVINWMFYLITALRIQEIKKK